MYSIEIPDYIFKTEIHFNGEKKFTDIAVFQNNREKPIFCAWLEDTKYWVEKDNEVWIEHFSGIETVISRQIGIAIEKEKIFG